MHLYWDEYNPWREHLIYLPNLKEVSACLNPGSPEYQHNKWRTHYNLMVDAYILPQRSGYHEVGIRFGKDGPDYLSPYMNRYLIALLINKYYQFSYFMLDEEDKFRFYQCPKCSMLHPVPWLGSCTNEASAYSEDMLDKMHGPLGWKIVPNPHHRLENSCTLEN